MAFVAILNAEILPTSQRLVNMLSDSEANLALVRTTNPLNSAIMSKKTSGR